MLEQKQGVVTGATEVAVVGRGFLVAVGRADAGVHIENHHLWRAAVVDPIDPSPEQVGKGSDVVIGGQKLSLKFPADHAMIRFDRHLMFLFLRGL